MSGKEEEIRKSFKKYAADGKIQVSELQEIVKKMGGGNLDNISAQQLLIFIAGPDRKMSETEWTKGISAYLNTGVVPPAYWLLAKQEEEVRKSFKEYAADGKIQVSELQEIIKKVGKRDLDSKFAQQLLIYIAGPDRKMNEKEWVRGIMAFLSTGYVPIPFWTPDNQEIIRKSFKEYAADGIIEVWELQDIIKKVGGQVIERSAAQKLLIFIAGPDRKMSEAEWVKGISAYLKLGAVPEATWLQTKSAPPPTGKTIKNKRKQLRRSFVQYSADGKIQVAEVQDALKKVGNIDIDKDTAQKLLIYVAGKDKKMSVEEWVKGLREYIRNGKVPFASWMDPEQVIRESFKAYASDGKIQTSELQEILKKVDREIDTKNAQLLLVYIAGPDRKMNEKEWTTGLMAYYRTGVVPFVWWTDEGKDLIRKSFKEYAADGKIQVSEMQDVIKRFGNRDLDTASAQKLLLFIAGPDKRMSENEWVRGIYGYLYTGIVAFAWWQTDIQELIRKSFAEYAADGKITVAEMQDVIKRFGGQVITTEKAQKLLLYMAGPDRKMNEYEWVKGIVFYLRTGEIPLLFWSIEVQNILKSMFKEYAGDGKIEVSEMQEAIQKLNGVVLDNAQAKQLLLFIAGPDKKMSEKEWVRGITSFLRSGLIPVPYWTNDNQEALRKSFKDYAADGKITVSEMQDVVKKFGGQEIDANLAQQLLIFVAGKDKKMNKGEWVKGITAYLKTGQIPKIEDDDEVGVDSD